MFHCFFYPPVVSQEKPSAAKEQELKQQASRARLEAQASRQVDQSKARQASMSSMSSTSEPAGVAGATGQYKISLGEAPKPLSWFAFNDLVKWSTLHTVYTLWWTNSLLLKMAIEIVDWFSH